MFSKHRTCCFLYLFNNETCIICFTGWGTSGGIISEQLIFISANSKNVFKNLTVVEDVIGLCGGAYDVINCSSFPD